MKAAWDFVNRNPLGSAAGYGSSAPLDREMTTRLLGFDTLDYNSVYAQMTRGKMERIVSFAYSCIAETVGKLACDGCLFSSQNFGFLHLPDALTTGSSIMPHKKNPDVFELVRAHCNRILAVPGSVRLVTGNLPSGYFRDLQVLKEVFFPIFDVMDDCLDIVGYAVRGMEVNTGVMEDPRYKLSFSVEEVNRLVESGVPFRDAYRQVAASIQDGSFEFHGKLEHTHEGSIGNLCNDRVAARLEKVLEGFGFDKVRSAIAGLAGE
jgi:argininosuccinate lyase